MAEEKKIQKYGRSGKIKTINFKELAELNVLVDEYLLFIVGFTFFHGFLRFVMGEVEEEYNNNHL